MKNITEHAEQFGHVDTSFKLYRRNHTNQPSLDVPGKVCTVPDANVPSPIRLNLILAIILSLKLSLYTTPANSVWPGQGWERHIDSEADQACTVMVVGCWFHIKSATPDMWRHGNVVLPAVVELPWYYKAAESDGAIRPRLSGHESSLRCCNTVARRCTLSYDSTSVRLYHGCIFHHQNRA
jgi:hypothetical protein